MHDRLAKLLVHDSGTSNLDGELGSCAMGLTLGHYSVKWSTDISSSTRPRLVVAHFLLLTSAKIKH